MSIKVRKGADEALEICWAWELQRADGMRRARGERQWLDRNAACAAVRRLAVSADWMGMLRRFAAEAPHALLPRTGDVAVLADLARWIDAGKVRVAVDRGSAVIRAASEAIGEEAASSFAARARETGEVVAAEPGLVEQAERTFPLDLDVPAIVDAHREAARFGIPFCEECRRPAAPEEETFPIDIDVAAMVEAHREAARFGIPFCEECRE